MIKVATNFVSFLEGQEPTPELVDEFCNTPMKKSVVKYFLFSNEITFEVQEDIRDYTESIYPDVTDFLKYKEFTSCQQSTIRDYRAKLENFYNVYSKMNENLDYDITEDDVKDFLKNKKVTVKSVYINLFTQYFKYHKKEFSIFVNKKEIRKAKAEKTIEKVLNRDETKKLLKYIDKLNESDDNEYLLKSIFTLYLYTGCRLIELQQLNFSDVDLKRKEAWVTGKGNKKRRAYFNSNPNMTKFLKNHFNRYKDQLKIRDLPLILNHNFQRVSTSHIQELVKNTFKTLGFDNSKSTHSLRHTYGTILVNNGVKLKNIQKALGHEDIETTLIYADISAQTKKAVNGKFKV